MNLSRFFGRWNVYFQCTDADGNEIPCPDNSGGGDQSQSTDQTDPNANTDPGFVTPDVPQAQPDTGSQDQGAPPDQGGGLSQDQIDQINNQNQSQQQVDQTLSMSPPGVQAPSDQTNIDLSTGQVYPPGLIAPAGTPQVNVSPDLLGPLQAQISQLTSGLKSYNPALAAQMAQVAQSRAQMEFDRWKTQLQYTNLTAQEKEQIALQQAQLAADTSIRQAQVALQQRTLELQYTQMTPFQKEQLATQRAIADMQSQLQRDLQTSQIASQEKLSANTLASQERISQGQLLQRERESGRQTAMGLLQQVSQLRGPQNAFTLLRTLQAIPGGLQGLVRGLAGEFNLPTSGGVTAGTPASLGGQIGDILGNGQGQLTPEEQQAAGTFVNPNQVPIQNWANLPDYVKQVALGQWESEGLDPGMVQQIIRNNAPQFQTPAVGRVNAFQ